MRTFALATILLCTLVTPIIGQTITVTPGPALQPLPKFVQELTPDDFQVWADWQNRQAAARAAEKGLPDLPELPWRRVIRETTASGATHVSANTTIGSASRLQSGREAVVGVVAANRVVTVRPTVSAIPLPAVCANSGRLTIRIPTTPAPVPLPFTTLIAVLPEVSVLPIGTTFSSPRKTARRAPLAKSCRSAGRLTRKRSTVSCSPLTTIEACDERTA